MSSADPLLSATADRLFAAGCVAGGEEAVDLIAAAPDEATLESWVGRRLEGEPLAWIIGSIVFGGRTVLVTPGVYVPRLQSQELARRAAAVLGRGGRCIDLCTGSGAVAAYLRARVPEAVIIGVDIDERAARCARANGIPTLVADLDGALRPATGVDVVTAVAPYVPSAEMRFLPADVQRYEARSALDGGTDGLDLVRRVVAAASRLLRHGGWLLVELGGAQDATLAPDLDASGFDMVEAWWDDEGDLRGVATRWTGGSPSSGAGPAF